LRFIPAMKCRIRFGGFEHVADAVDFGICVAGSYEDSAGDALGVGRVDRLGRRIVAVHFHHLGQLGMIG
jgi:hypothetical protein